MARTEKITIAITGPESTGKSLLSEQLAAHFNTIWVPEYAREFLDKLGRPYHYDDILLIAKEQLKQQETTGKKARDYFICDTELTVLKIWCEFKYGKCHPWILDRLDKQHFDLYLLMNIDLPWEFDPQREHPAQRKELLNLYLKEMQSRHFNFTIISGQGQQRLRNALKAIEALK